MEDNHLSLLVNIDQKVDEVKDKLHGIEVIQSRMESDLKYHIKRTDLLENRVETINDKVESLDISRILLSKIAKAIPIIAGVIVAILTILKLIKG